MKELQFEKPARYGVQIRNWNGEWVYDCYDCNRLWAESLMSYHRDRGHDARMVKISEVVEVVSE